MTQYLQYKLHLLNAKSKSSLVTSVATESNIKKALRLCERLLTKKALQ